MNLKPPSRQTHLHRQRGNSRTPRSQGTRVSAEREVKSKFPSKSLTRRSNASATRASCQRSVVSRKIAFRQSSLAFERSTTKRSLSDSLMCCGRRTYGCAHSTKTMQSAKGCRSCKTSSRLMSFYRVAKSCTRCWRRNWRIKVSRRRPRSSR